MEDIIGNIENLLVQFQLKFVEIEDILHNANKQFSQLKLEYVKYAPNQDDSVMSMKDFVSYMSALEETEADETSQNISELPLDNDENSNKIENEEVIDSTNSTNNNNGNNSSLQLPFDRNRMRKSYSNSFGWHEVIHEEDENIETNKENKNNTGQSSNKRQRHKSESNLNVTNKKIPRPTSIITNPNVFKRPHHPALVTLSNSSKHQKTVKPTNLDFVNIRVRPDLRTLPTLQHPETAVLASASPSPMTPSDDKIPRLDLDKINNNPCPTTTTATKTMKTENKFQIKETKLPQPSKAVLSPTSTPRGNIKDKAVKVPKSKSDSSITSSSTLQRSRSVCGEPDAELVQCKRCGKIKCVQPNHQHDLKIKKPESAKKY